MLILRRPSGGLSMVELMVAVTVGLLLVAGAVSLFASHVSNGRKLLLEARLEQDLRSAADLLTRDLRRAGYWQNAIRGTVATGATSVTTPNEYAGVAASGVTITYGYARDANNTLDNNEQFGFRLNSGSGAVEMQTSAGTWQQVTDPNLVVMTALAIVPTTTNVDARVACARPCCTAADVIAATCATVTLSSGNCPTLTVRQYDITLTGRAVGDAAVTRSLQTRVRLRNDATQGVCPA